MVAYVFDYRVFLVIRFADILIIGLFFYVVLKDIRQQTLVFSKRLISRFFMICLWGDPLLDFLSMGLCLKKLFIFINILSF